MPLLPETDFEGDFAMPDTDPRQEMQILVETLDDLRTGNNEMDYYTLDADQKMIILLAQNVIYKLTGRSK